MAYPPAPPLLLTRRLSSFLHASIETLQAQKDRQPPGATLQTALLVTQSGKLLAYDSPLPVRTLRTHCSVAASLWTIHAASSPSVAVALGHTAPVPHSQALHQQQSLSAATLLPERRPGGAGPPGSGAEDEEPYHDGSAPVSIAVSFSGGAVFVVRRLRCGLLFACSTPPATTTASGSASRPATAAGPADTAEAAGAAPLAPGMTQSSLLPQSALKAPAPPQPAAASPPSSTASPAPLAVAPPPTADFISNSLPAASVRTTATAETYRTAPSGQGEAEAAAGDDAGAGADAGTAPGAADHAANADAASITTTGTAATVGGGHDGKSGGSIAATLAIARRQVDELARLLDEKLGSLSVPDDNIGINGFC